MTASNSLGTGPSSAEVSAVPAAVPNAPRVVRARAGEDFVTITWEAPSYDGGSPVLGYQVFEAHSSGKENGSPLKSAVLPPGTKSYVWNGLRKGVRYFFEVKAIDEAGPSRFSNQTSAVPT